MQENTKKVFSKYLESAAKQYGVADTTEMFSVNPAGTQRIIGALRESNDFMKKINVITVKNQIGEAIGLGVTGMIASRTDTSGDKERKPKDHSGMKAMPYVCSQTNFDTATRYAKIDAWAHLKNFTSIITAHTREQIVANQITVGWYGESAQATTNATTNPNGEDVNKGWFQALREHASERMLTEVVDGSGVIKIGEGGDFVNLDLAVLNVRTLLDPVCENDSNLVAIIGSSLLAYDKAKFYELHGNTPSEKSKIEEKQVISAYGGLPAVSVPGFPQDGILVTSYDNLSIYIQEGSVRRTIGKKNDAKDQVENFESMNIAYVIEHLEKAAALEFKNVKLNINGEWV
ncbi:phage major capsid protein, P2 family [Vibrio sp. OPT18]|uniref:phage major capsid protein, P2 family n=1 Tax=Vibrio sp. OPT18 TaxID=2778641 RepID=UPI001882C764|nr:phage major capsid protein, P2 family [Vibrio sp. OPT18]MBE8574455.1 phage major capsid protein, P2 family [Vibrio sp. OPT18]